MQHNYDTKVSSFHIALQSYQESNHFYLVVKDDKYYRYLSPVEGDSVDDFIQVKYSSEFVYPIQKKSFQYTLVASDYKIIGARIYISRELANRYKLFMRDSIVMT